MTKIAVPAAVDTDPQIGRLKQLQDQLRSEASGEKDKLVSHLLAGADWCRDVATIETMPAGVREKFRRLGDHIRAEVESVKHIGARG